MYANDNLHYVHLQGLLTSWNPEHLIFNDIFTRFPNFDATTTSLLITEPYLNPPALGENYDQMIFEEWEFASYARSCGESSLWSGSGQGWHYRVGPGCLSFSLCLHFPSSRFSCCSEQRVLYCFLSCRSCYLVPHAYRNYEHYQRLILTIHMPHFAPLRSTSLAAALVPYGGLFEIPGSPSAPCSILIDVGYSYSHVTPVVDGKVIWSGIRR